jgi:hypothetical protein
MRQTGVAQLRVWREPTQPWPRRGAIRVRISNASRFGKSILELILDPIQAFLEQSENPAKWRCFKKYDTAWFLEHAYESAFL